MANNQLKNFIEIIKTGNRADVREAQKQIEKYWSDVYIPHRKEGRKAFEIYLDEIRDFEKIKDIDHQAYFISTLKWPFWVIGEEHFEEWAAFILKYIQHDSGKIRQAVIYTADYLVIDITHDLLFDNNQIKGRDKERIEENKKRFGELVLNVEELIGKYDDPRYRRYKYISSMPAGVYKSLQKLITEVLLRTEHYEKLYDEYLGQQNYSSLKGKYKDVKIDLLKPIKLKYFHATDDDGKEMSHSDIECSVCGKKGIKIGGGLRDGDGKVKYICENCAIEDFKNKFGIKTIKEAATLRRRMFDVPYLFTEMALDKLREQDVIDDPEDLEIDEFKFLSHSLNETYDRLFTKEQKEKLEIMKQEEIERIFRGRIEQENGSPQ